MLYESFEHCAERRPWTKILPKSGRRAPETMKNMTFKVWPNQASHVMVDLAFHISRATGFPRGRDLFHSTRNEMIYARKILASKINLKIFHQKQNTSWKPYFCQLPENCQLAHPCFRITLNRHRWKLICSTSHLKIAWSDALGEKSSPKPGGELPKPWKT